MKAKSAQGYKRLILSGLFTAGMLTIGMQWVQGVHLNLLVKQLLWPLLRLMIYIGIGLGVGQLIEATGWTRHLARVTGPLFNFGNLGPHCGAAFVTAFFSGVAANAMLYEFYQENKICKAQLYLANFVNQLPAYFLHLPTTVFIVVPLTGRAGLLYFAVTFGAVLLRTAFFILYGRWGLPRNVCTLEQLKPGPAAAQHPTKAISAWETVRTRLPKRLMNVAVFVVPVYVLVYVVNAAGFFNWARDAMARFVTTAFIPVEALSFVVLSFVAEFTSGFAAAGALLQSGVLSIKQTVAALVIGNIIAFPMRALRHQLPHYAGIFTPRMGSQILLLGQGFRILSLAAVLAVYYVFA